MAAYCPTIVGPSRASQICRPSAGVFGFLAYCQFQRS
jgi:hypothetical protein